MNNETKEVSSGSQPTSVPRVAGPSIGSDEAGAVHAGMPALDPINPESPAQSAHAASWAPRR